MIQKIIDDIYDHLTNRNKKDRSKELWDALNHIISTIEAYGYMDVYEGNPEWEPPVWLRDGDYTTEKRLQDIRYHSIQIRKAKNEVKKVLLKMDEMLDIPYNY